MKITSKNCSFKSTLKKSRILYFCATAFSTILFVGCATTTPPPPKVNAPYSEEQMQRAQSTAVTIPVETILKRKVAIGRFTNETRYGRTLLRDGDMDPLGKQAGDMLSNRLVSSKKFLVFERPDIAKIDQEQFITNKGNLIGVDTLIMGSVTEFARVNQGKQKFLSSTKKQIAHCVVEIRLVDVNTGLVFFSARGQAEASTETGNTAGYGSRADYDATLNDKVIGAAISDVMNEVVSKLDERPWKTNILDVQNSNILISGGRHQGLQVGDSLVLVESGKKVRSQQTGFNIELPGTNVAVVEVVSFFGDTAESEGSITKIISGNTPNEEYDTYYLTKQ